MPRLRKVLTFDDLTAALAQYQQDMERGRERVMPLIDDEDEVGYSEELAKAYQVQSQQVLTNAEVNTATSWAAHGLPIIYQQLLELVGPFQIGTHFNRLSLYHSENGLHSIGRLLEMETFSKKLNNFNQGHYHKYLIFAEIGDAFSIGEHDAWEALAFNREQPNEILTVSVDDHHMSYPNNDRICLGDKGQQLTLNFLIKQIKRIHEDGITAWEEIEQQYSSDDEWGCEISEDLESELPKETDLYEFCIRWFDAIKGGNADAYKDLIANHDDFQEQIKSSGFNEKAKQKSLAKLKVHHLKFEERLSDQFRIAHSALTLGEKEKVILMNTTVKEFEQRGIIFHRVMLHFSEIRNSEINSEFEIKLTDLLQTSRGWRLFGSVDLNRWRQL